MKAKKYDRNSLIDPIIYSDWRRMMLESLCLSRALSVTPIVAPSLELKPAHTSLVLYREAGGTRVRIVKAARRRVRESRELEWQSTKMSQR